MQNLSFACKNLAPVAAFLRFSIFNSKIVGNRYEPNIQIDTIAKTMFFPGSMPDVATNTSYYLNKLLINGMTTNGIWFLKVNVTSGSVRNAYSTSVNKSFSYQYRTDTGLPYLRYHDVDFAFNLSFSPYNISLPVGIVKEGSLTNIICNFNQMLLFNLSADLSQTFDFGMYENYMLHSFTYNLDFEEYGSYSYELIIDYSLILNQTYEILFNKFDFDIMDIGAINMYSGIMRIEYVISVNSIPTTYTENIVFNDFLII